MRAGTARAAKPLARQEAAARRDPARDRRRPPRCAHGTRKPDAPRARLLAPAGAPRVVAWPKSPKATVALRRREEGAIGRARARRGSSADDGAAAGAQNARGSRMRTAK